jgi:hypothetical protein
MKSRRAYPPFSPGNLTHILLLAVPAGMPACLVDSMMRVPPSLNPHEAADSCTPLATDQTPTGTLRSCAKPTLAIALPATFDGTAHLCLVYVDGGAWNVILVCLVSTAIQLIASIGRLGHALTPQGTVIHSHAVRQAVSPEDPL